MGNTVAPSVNLSGIPAQPSPLQPGFRLMPAKIGQTNDTSVLVYVQCPLWCVEDHVAEPVVHIEDLMHRSGDASVGVRSFLRDQFTHELAAYLESDPVSKNPLMHAAHVVVEDGGNEYAYLTPAMAEQLADNLIGFASELRTLARTARQANRTGGAA